MKDLHLYIRFGNEDIEHVVQGYIYSDGCYCPETNLTQWFDSFECSTSRSQLRTDMEIFKTIDMKQVLEKATLKYFQHPQTYALCHYVIKNNKVNTKCTWNKCKLLLFCDRFIENVTVNTQDLKCFPMRYSYHFLAK